MKSLLDKTDRFVKRVYRREGVSEKASLEDRKEIRETLIKQTFVKKLLLNNNESNFRWGLIQRNGRFRVAPMFGFEDCCAIPSVDANPIYRVVSGIGPFKHSEDIQSFMLAFGEEEWFRDWVKDCLDTFSLDDAIQDAKDNSNCDLSEAEIEYYKAVLDRTIGLAYEVINNGFDRNNFSMLSLLRAKPKALVKNIDKDDDIDLPR